MKKVMAILIMMAMALTLSSVAFANNGGFIQSPSASNAVTLLSYKFHDAQGDDVLWVGLTRYADRDMLPPEDKALLEQAYDSIVANADLTGLVNGLKKIADKLKASVGASELFDLKATINGDEAHDTPIDVVLEIEDADKFAAFIHMDAQGNWTVVEGAKINADGNLEATLPEYSPFAIVLATGVNPGDSIDIAIYASIMAVAAIAVVLVIRKSSKQGA